MAAELLHLAVNPRELLGSNGLGRFDSQIRPDFGQVGFGGVRQTEGKRPANSFLPRSIILSMSKSATRPAVRSAMPLSISARRASSSPSFRVRFTFQSRSASRVTDQFDVVPLGKRVRVASENSGCDDELAGSAPRHHLSEEFPHGRDGYRQGTLLLALDEKNSSPFFQTRSTPPSAASASSGNRVPINRNASPTGTSNSCQVISCSAWPG